MRYVVLYHREPGNHRQVWHIGCATDEGGDLRRFFPSIEEARECAAELKDCKVRIFMQVDYTSSEDTQ